MKQRAEQLRAQAEYFRLPVPSFSDLEEVEVDVALYEQRWSVYESFEQGRGWVSVPMKWWFSVL